MPGRGWRTLARMDRSQLTVALVRCLIARSFPEWADLPIRPVDRDGWDNATFRLGDELSVRLPTADGYVPQVAKERRWLPVLARSLPVAIPEPVGTGTPGCGFERPWSVRRWLDGEDAGVAPIADAVAFAKDVAGFLHALHRIDASDGPVAGPHSFWRGGPLEVYDAETRAAVDALGHRIDGPAALRTWEAALDQPWRGRPVWVHGDLAPSNLLVRAGRLGAVLDFGCLAVGDPACDTVLAWTFFGEAASDAFRRGVALDHGTWARGRAWALWKALITLREHADDPESLGATVRRVGWGLGPAAIIERITAER
jgi:aminoglycoside phosphotransferase (APT) family kinase protein